MEGAEAPEVRDVLVEVVGRGGYTGGHGWQDSAGWHGSGGVGLYWARPNLMVALLTVIAVGVYGWRHPDLDEWSGHRGGCCFKEFFWESKSRWLGVLELDDWRQR